MHAVARIGLTARGIVYLPIGALVLLVAHGSPMRVDQGATAGFMRYFPGGSTSTRTRRAIRTIGRIGTRSLGRHEWP